MKTETRKTRFFDEVLGVLNARHQQKLLISHQNKQPLSPNEVNQLRGYRTQAEEYKGHSEPQGWHNYTSLVAEIISRHEQPTPEPERPQNYQPAFA